MGEGLMWKGRNWTEGMGQQTGLSPSGQTRALSAWKRSSDQARRPTDRWMVGETESWRDGQAGRGRESLHRLPQRKWPTLPAWEPLEPWG